MHKNPEKISNTIVSEIDFSDKKSLKKFVKLERKFIGQNSLYVPETDSSVLKRLGGQSAFFNDMKQILLVASEGTINVARCAALINHRYQQAKNEALGFIGYFAAAPDATSEVSLMLDMAEAWLREQNVSRVIAPYNGSFLLGLGLLTSGYDEDPLFPFGWHPPYYPEYFLNSGYQPTYPLWCYNIDFSSENYRIATQRALENSAVKIFPLDRRNWDADLDEFRGIINEAFKEEWEVHPHTDKEFHEIFDPMKSIVDTWLFLIAEVGGKPAGFCWGMPDWNPLFRSFRGKAGPLQLIKFIWKSKRYQRAGLVGIGVLPGYKGTGVAQALAVTLYRNFEERGLKGASYYIVNESNIRSRRFAESLGGIGRVLYHCYDKRLE